MTRPVLLAAAVAVLANAVALTQAVRNRMGEPEASVELTERELRLNAVSEESTARWGTLVFQHRPSWIAEGPLAAMGFDFEPGRRLPRPGFLALEFDPEAKAGAYASRLVPVDAGSDPAALRARQPDRGRVLILRAVFRRAETKPPRGEVAYLLPSRVSIPAGTAAGIRPYGGDSYVVRLTVGRNYEPYVTSFRRP